MKRQSEPLRDAPPLPAGTREVESKRVRPTPLDQLDRLRLLSGENVVLTQAFRQLIEKMRIFAKAQVPILIEGDSCVGKTTLIETFAYIQDRELLVINVGEQTDAKALLGLYITDDSKPGAFKWMPGVLSEAIKTGFWILIEDIHLASMEILALLQPLLDSGKLFVPGTGEVLSVAPSTCILATLNWATNKATSIFESFSADLWHRLAMEAPTEAELTSIATHKYDGIESAVPLCLRIYDRLHALRNQSDRALKNLFRLCERLSLNRGLFQLSDADGYGETAREAIFVEAFDINGSHLVKMEARLELVSILADILYLTQDRGLELAIKRAPTLTIHDDRLQVGRVCIPRLALQAKPIEIAPTKLSKQIIEKLAYSVHLNDPVLLVGETGTGKTTLVQELCKASGQSRLIVINMSHQTEVSDLLGGFRPLSASSLAKPVYEKFERLFSQTVIGQKNATYLEGVLAAFQRQSWQRFVKLIRQVMDTLKSKLGARDDWDAFVVQLEGFAKQAQFLRSNMLFGFIEGALVQAIKEGHWLLLDEINLASAETLEILSGLLRSKSSSLLINDRGDKKPIERHPNFRLFACMNPATDVSKKDLPPSIKYRFTELYVDETDIYSEDLRRVIEYVLGSSTSAVSIDAIVDLYYTFKNAVSGHLLVDGSNRRPLLNLRTLTRALKFSKRIKSLYGIQRALFEGFAMAFVTTLGDISRSKALEILAKKLTLKLPLPSLKPPKEEVSRWLEGSAGLVIDGFVVPMGPEQPVEGLEDRFVLTPSVKKNVAFMARALMGGRYPILLEGPTSSGKTSVVEYLAMRTGHKFVRINNHEHTDIQEYIGAYQPDPKTGLLVFKEGLLVEALRNGYWLVLDELNLAPSDVLEALNRLLDDNRELFLAETNEVIQPHPSFTLFATQNPVGCYGGRKALSRAFRSRFLELQFDDLPVDEVELIITKRCKIAPSHAKKIATVYRQLQQKRVSANNAFSGRHALITLRDLFRWANRESSSVVELAENGFLVLAERIRHQEGRDHIKTIIESICKCPINEYHLYDLCHMSKARNWLIDPSKLTSGVTWTKTMQRLFSLVYQCYLNGEPVLLIGETGCGKTTVIQVLAQILGNELKILNCHQGTETSDLLGCLRPSRETADEGSPLFSWYDGPLVESMKRGNLFLLDEISLADDSVLERLNSMLEPHGTLVLAEHIGLDSAECQTIKPAKGFGIFATMNPGGDYGKKELSPALRNRFTEIWISSIGDDDDICLIVETMVKGTPVEDYRLGGKMVEFVNWWRSLIDGIPFLKHWAFSLRDILTWVKFILAFGTSLADHDLAFMHAAIMLFFDPALSRCQREDADDILSDYKKACFWKLIQILGIGENFNRFETLLNLSSMEVVKRSDVFGVAPFFLDVSSGVLEDPRFSFNAPTTFASLYRILRAMQLGSAILLEGSPGVGKTTLVDAIAKATGHNLVRINLSDQTDLIDLFGTDLPAEGQEVGKFYWCDGPFLRALKQGDWILLDELNLASQSVLEGLNACLDHRGSVFIPELNRTFNVSRSVRIFAAQNPLKQGGGRKGLPKSFVNRFVTVWFDQLGRQDYEVICKEAFQILSTEFIQKAITFNRRISEETASKRDFAMLGRPWEFNLRDLFRWFKLARSHPDVPPEYFVRTIYSVRLRSHHDRDHLWNIFEEIFGVPRLCKLVPYHISSETLYVGVATLPAGCSTRLQLPRFCLQELESIMLCLEQSSLALINGPSGSGKTSLVRLLAQLSGTRLVEFPMGPETDSLELLGSFEQMDASRLMNALVTKYGLTTEKELETMANIQDSIRVELEALRLHDGAAACFKWVDGPLTRALIDGHWIILDNPNLCSSAVLDRLNSLFEPNGCLSLDEASTGVPRIIRPHPNFRLFLLVDPKYGELSRAMRNRSIEICLMSSISATTFDYYDVASNWVGQDLVSSAVEMLSSNNLREFARACKILGYLSPDLSSVQQLGEILGVVEHAKRMLSEQELVWLESSVRLPSVIQSRSEFSFLAQTYLLKKWLETHQDPLETYPAILAYCSWALNEDVVCRQNFLKGLISFNQLTLVENPQNISLYTSIISLETFYGSEKISLLESFCGDIEPTLISLVNRISGETRTIKILNAEESNFFDHWKQTLIHFGFRSYEVATLFKRFEPLLQTRDLEIKLKVANMYCTLVKANIEGHMDLSNEILSSIEYNNLDEATEQVIIKVQSVLCYFFDPITDIVHQYLPSLQKSLLYQTAEAEFLQLYQSFYFGANISYESDLQKTREQLHRMSSLQRFRSNDFSFIELKALISQVLPHRKEILDVHQLENIRGVLQRLGNSEAADIVVEPLCLLHELLLACNLKHVKRNLLPAPSFIDASCKKHSTDLYCYYVIFCDALIDFGLSGSTDQLSTSLIPLAENLSSLISRKLIDSKSNQDLEHVFEKGDDLKDIAVESFRFMEKVNKGSVDVLETMSSMTKVVIERKMNQFITPHLLWFYSTSQAKLLHKHSCDGDIFSHLCPDIALSLINCLEKFRNVLSDRLKQFPEHDILHSLVHQIDQLVGQKFVNESLISIAASVQQILIKANSWEEVSSTRDKFGDSLKEVVAFLGSLRLKELHSWKHLDQLVSAAFQKNAICSWSSLVVLLTNTKSPIEVVEILDAYLLSCPIGEFEFRLNIVNELSKWDKILNFNVVAIRNCYLYFAQFLPSIHSSLKEKLRPILNSHDGLLASITWHDQTILYSLDYSRKIHQEIRKSYHALSEILQMPTSNQIMNLKTTELNENLEQSPSESLATNLPSFEYASCIFLEYLSTFRVHNAKDGVKEKHRALLSFLSFLKEAGLKLNKPFTTDLASVQSILGRLPDMQTVGSSKFVIKSISLFSDFLQNVTDPHESNTKRQIDIFKTVFWQLLEILIQLGKKLESLTYSARAVENHFREVDRFRSNEAETLRILKIDAIALRNRLSAFVGACKRVTTIEAILPSASSDIVLQIEADVDNFESLFKDLMSMDNIAGAVGLVRKPLLTIAPKFTYLKKSYWRSYLVKTSKTLSDALEALNAIPTFSLELNVPIIPSAEALKCLITPHEDISGKNLEEIYGNVFNLYEQYFSNCLSVSSLPDLLEKLSANNDSRSENYNDFLEHLSNILQQQQYLYNHLAKFVYVVGSIFNTIVQDGFCKPDMVSDATTPNDGEEQPVENGMGIAEGKGEKDVSNEMEFEEQVTGASTDQRNDVEAPEESDVGLNMDQDFDAQLENLSNDLTEEDSSEDNIDDQVGDNEALGEQDDHELNLDQGADDKSEHPYPESIGAEKISIEESANDDGTDQNAAEYGDSSTEGEERCDSDDELDGVENCDADKNELDLDNDVDESAVDQSGILDSDSDVESSEDDVDISESGNDAPSTNDAADSPMSTSIEKGFDEENSKEQGEAKVDCPDVDRSQDKLTAASASSAIENLTAGINSSFDPNRNRKNRIERPNHADVDSITDKINRSVHEILKSDNAEEQVSEPSNLTLQQLYQHSDEQNALNLAAGNETSNGLRNQVEDVNEYEEGRDDSPEAKADDENTEGQLKIGPTLKGPTDIGEKKALIESQLSATFDWTIIENECLPLSLELCEQLRLVLEPTKASKLKGDYRTGKRLHLKKLIPYIISQYRKDKIWMRRTKPLKRTYRICLSVDNSKSMADSGSDIFALKTTAILLQALGKLESGKVGLIGFGNSSQIVCPLSDRPYNSALGESVLRALDFSSDSTDVAKMLKKSIEMFTAESEHSETWDLNIILSDGVCQDHQSLLSVVNESLAKKIIPIFIILDSRPESQSILEISKVEYVPVSEGGTKILMRKYLESFPFENYVVVRDISSLPVVLSDSIRQWFELVTSLSR